MTMIERVAEGQAAYDGRTLVAMPRGERERYYERARLAISFMRAPTVRMLIDALVAVIEAMGDDAVCDYTFNERRRAALAKAKGKQA